jgi:tetrahydromethanopterin S-methyltransferase subunit E
MTAEEWLVAVQSDVRRQAEDEADWYKFGSGTSRSTAQSLIDRAYECGIRKGIEEQQVHAAFQECSKEHGCGTCGIEETGRCDRDEEDS